MKPGGSLVETLLEMGLIEAKELNAIRKLQKENREKRIPIDRLLLSEKLVTEDQLLEAYTKMKGMEYVDLDKFHLDASLKTYISYDLAKQYHILPLKIDGNTLAVATDNPNNYSGFEAVKMITGMRIIPYIAYKETLDHAILEFYGNDRTEKMAESISDRSVMDYTEFANRKYNVTEDESIEEAPARGLLNSIFEKAVAERASDIHIQPSEKECIVKFRVDNIEDIAFRFEAKVHRTLVSRIKIQSGLNVQERRIPQDGRSTVVVNGNEYDLRVNTLPSQYGESVVIRLLKKNDFSLSRTQIGLTAEDYVKYDTLIEKEYGVILIVGPTGSGKSSTMNSMAQILSVPEKTMITLEDPIEYQVEGAVQVQINPAVGLTFEKGLEAILRHDPNIIIVGEIRNFETATIAMRAAETGHLVISTLHTNDAVSAFTRLRDIGVEPYLIGDGVIGVISQRLVRKLCPNCKEKYVPTDEELSQFGPVEEMKKHTYYRGKGCPACQKKGYRGRTGIFEILVLNEELKRAITDGKSKTELFKIARTAGMVTLKENALKLVWDGVSSLQEIAPVLRNT